VYFSIFIKQCQDIFARKILILGHRAGIASEKYRLTLRTRTWYYDYEETPALMLDGDV
jgi:hypothetical protein